MISLWFITSKCEFESHKSRMNLHYTLHLVASSRRTSLDTIPRFVSRPFITRVRRLWTVKDPSSHSSSPSYFPSSTVVARRHCSFSYFTTLIRIRLTSRRWFVEFHFLFLWEISFYFSSLFLPFWYKNVQHLRTCKETLTEISHWYHINIYYVNIVSIST